MDNTYPHTYEHSPDRVACALGGQAVLPPAFTFIPAMLASHDWRLRHAGLMAIASIAEGTSKVMQGELGKVIECVRVLSRLFVYACSLSFSAWLSLRSTTRIRACATQHASACKPPLWPVFCACSSHVRPTADSSAQISRCERRSQR